jgi:hypothetical protein
VLPGNPSLEDSTLFGFILPESFLDQGQIVFIILDERARRGIKSNI